MDTTIGSYVRRAGYNTPRRGCSAKTESKGQSVKTRIMLLAVVLGTMVFALALADGGPWPPT